jgi:hypothetical protein
MCYKKHGTYINKDREAFVSEISMRSSPIHSNKSFSALETEEN